MALSLFLELYQYFSSKHLINPKQKSTLVVSHSLPTPGIHQLISSLYGFAVLNGPVYSGVS